MSLVRMVTDTDPPDMEVEVRVAGEAPRVAHNFSLVEIECCGEDKVWVSISGRLSPPYSMSQADWLEALCGAVRQMAGVAIEAAVFQGVPASVARRNVLVAVAQAIDDSTEVARQ